jgi:hypothetical protein
VRRYFYDFEFLEDGRTIDPISVGVVCDDGRQFYAVFEEIGSNDGRRQLYDRIRRHPWLMANVIPHLPLNLRTYGGKGYKVVDLLSVAQGGAYQLDPDSTLIRPANTIRKELKAFLLHGHEEGVADIELWAYFAAYDHVALAQLLGGPMANLPAGIPFWTHDLKQELDRRGVSPDQLVGRNPDEEPEHDALADARWNYQVWQVLEEQKLAEAAR